MSKNIGTCFLCGGRVRNGICTECGMDNRKSDDSYRLNTGECDREPLTHVHVHEKEESEKKEKVKKAADSERKKNWKLNCQECRGEAEKLWEILSQQREKASSQKDWAMGSYNYCSHRNSA